MKKIKFAAMCGLFAMMVGAVVGCGDGTNTSTSGPQACTEIGCGPALEVALARASWPAGKVDIVVVADGTTTTCSVTLPFASCDNLVQCDMASPAFAIETSGCALPMNQHAVTGVMWSTSGPKDVTITVSQDGMMLGSKMFQPMYSSSQPNGPGCEPTCNQATAPASIQLP